MKIIGYIRVSTGEQAESGAGLAAQRATLEREIAVREWELIEICEDAGVSGSTLRREGLHRALGLIEAGQADALAVAKLDRLSRSLLDFAALMDRSRKNGWAVVALDVGVDTTTPNGEMVANVMATFAQFERQLIGQRTKEALAMKRAAGVRLGRPPSVPLTTVRRTRKLRADGMTYQAIAGVLNAQGVPTGQGGRQWWPATVRKVLLAHPA